MVNFIKTDLECLKLIKNEEGGIMTVDKLKSSQTVEEEIEIQDPPGEYLMLFILFIILFPIMLESLKVNGMFQGSLSGPGVLPQIMTNLTLIMVLSMVVKLAKRGIKPKKLSEVANYLFCKNNIILLIAVLAYAFFVGILHFRIATLLFLSVCMWMLDKKKPINKLVISTITLFVLEVIFSVIFKVILP